MWIFSMADMKYSHCLKVYKTACKITKYLLMYKVKQKTVCYIISCQI